MTFLTGDYSHTRHIKRSKERNSKALKKGKKIITHSKRIKFSVYRDFSSPENKRGNKKRGLRIPVVLAILFFFLFFFLFKVTVR